MLVAHAIGATSPHARDFAILVLHLRTCVHKRVMFVRVAVRVARARARAYWNISVTLALQVPARAQMSASPT